MQLKTMTGLCLTMPLVGCLSTGPDPIKTFGNAWAQCLNGSFPAYAAQSPDPNTAAELAFLACQSEESILRQAAGYENGAQVDQIKLIAKRRLVAEGGVPENF